MNYNFSVGDQVWITTAQERTMTGTVEKISPNSIQIQNNRGNTLHFDRHNSEKLNATLTINGIQHKIRIKDIKKRKKSPC